MMPVIEFALLIGITIAFSGFWLALESFNKKEAKKKNEF